MPGLNGGLYTNLLISPPHEHCVLVLRQLDNLASKCRVCAIFHVRKPCNQRGLQIKAMDQSYLPHIVKFTLQAHSVFGSWFLGLSFLGVLAL